MSLKTQFPAYTKTKYPIELSDTEQEILVILAEFPGTPITLEEITDLGGYKSGDTTLGEALGAVNHLLAQGYLVQYELLMPLFGYAREVTLYGYVRADDYAPLVMFRDYIAGGNNG